MDSIRNTKIRLNYKSNPAQCVKEVENISYRVMRFSLLSLAVTWQGSTYCVLYALYFRKILKNHLDKFLERIF